MPPFEVLKESFPSDSEILKLLATDSDKAWDLFIEKHADLIFTVLRRNGLDQERASDCFVYVCEKLSEKEFRRLKTVKYLGQKGDLAPWLRQVVNRLLVNWFWSVNGRKRLPKAIEGMTELEREIFKLYFWKGQNPSRVFESLLLGQEKDIELADVFDALEKIFGVLSEKKLWSLMSGLLRTRHQLSIDKTDEETGLSIDPVDREPLPEIILTRKEDAEILNKAVESLSSRERLVVQMRYEDTLSSPEIAEILNLEIREIKNLLKSSLYKLRKILL